MLVVGALMECDDSGAECAVSMLLQSDCGRGELPAKILAFNEIQISPQSVNNLHM